MAKATTKATTTKATKLSDADRKAMNTAIAKYTGTNPDEAGSNILLDAAVQAYDMGIALKSIRLDGVVHITKLDRQASKDGHYLFITLSCMGQRRTDVRVRKGTPATLEVLARQAVGKDGQPISIIDKFAATMGLGEYVKPESSGAATTAEDVDINDLV